MIDPVLRSDEALEVVRHGPIVGHTRPVSLDVVTALFLIVVPILFNVAFFELGRAFDYPDILRREPDEILRRFHAGGTGLLLRWHLLMLSALAMAPLVALLAVALGAAPALTTVTIVVGVAAGLLQALGLLRWPYAVPELARRWVAADGDGSGEATRRSIEVTFAILHRYLGVGVGEHLGYLLTGLWTLLTAASIVTTTAIPAWLGWIGALIGLALIVGSAEFAGPNERDGWRLAGIVVPIAYIAWSIWLIPSACSAPGMTDDRACRDRLARPVDEVLAVLTDPTKTPVWSSSAVEERWLDPSAASASAPGGSP